MLIKSCLPPSKEDTFFLSCLSITKVCTCNSQKFVLPSHKSLYLQLTKFVHFKSEFLKTFHAWLPYRENCTVMSFLIGPFCRSYCPFWPRIFQEKVCMHNSSFILKGNSLKLACLLITIQKMAYRYSILIRRRCGLDIFVWKLTFSSIEI